VRSIGTGCVDKALGDVRFVELLDVLDDDDVEIALAGGKAGYVPIQNLSARARPSRPWARRKRSVVTSL